MSVATFQFYISHKEPLVIITINSLKLFEVPVVGGNWIQGCGLSGRVTESWLYILDAQ